MNANLLTRFEAALAGDSLTELVRELEAEGLIQVEIFERFEQFRALLREFEREADEEQVMDTMDCIVGWCGTHAKLFQHYLTDEEIAAYRQSQRGVTPKQDTES
jgi:hypothetical protein